MERRHARAFQTSVALSAVLIVLVLGAEYLRSERLISNTDRSQVWLLIVNVVAVLGLQAFSGNTGKMTISHVGFLAVGAYVSALFTINPVMKRTVLQGLPDWLYATNLDVVWALLIAVMVAGFVAWLLGFIIVRLSFDGVVISTFALLLIIQSVILAAKGWTNGITSIFGMPKFSDPWTILIVAIAAVFVCAFFKESRIGLQTRAARDDRAAAEAMGVNSKRVTHIAWILSAMVGAAAGALLAHVIGAAGPRTFYIVFTIELIAMLVLGGQRSVTGGFAGAVLVTGIIIIVRKAEGGFTLGSLEMPPVFGATQLVLSFAILAILYVRPGGMTGLWEITVRSLLKPIEALQSKPRERAQDGQLALDGLSKEFGGLRALAETSFSLRSGEILGLIGPNGAGKTTLINTVMGTYFATSGVLSLNGEEATLWPASRLARQGIGRTFQQIKLAESLTVLENVMVPVSSTAPLTADLEATALGWLKTLKIDHLADSYPGALPYGDQRRVEIARALALEPSFLLLDEPAAGMNHEETDDLRQLLIQIRGDLNVGIIIVEHDLNLILSLCDKVVVLDRGTVISAGTPAEVRSDPAVIKAYIGTSQDGSGAKTP